jgi:hypothetical protein
MTANSVATNQGRPLKGDASQKFNWTQQIKQAVINQCQCWIKKFNQDPNQWHRAQQRKQHHKRAEKII